MTIHPSYTPIQSSFNSHHKCIYFNCNIFIYLFFFLIFIYYFLSTRNCVRLSLLPVDSDSNRKLLHNLGLILSVKMSDIVEFYRGRSVFITGATGFLGKVLVEKLLRSCPDIKAVYLLIRPKKGQDVSTRLQDFSQHVVSIYLNILQLIFFFFLLISSLIGSWSINKF